MVTNGSIRLLISAAAIAGLCACASPPTAQTPETTAPAASAARQQEPVWEGVSDAEVKKRLDRKFEREARSYVRLKKNGELMFCKRRKLIGSNLPTLQCLTEAELRNQVETMDEYRERRRHAAKCPHGPQGCSAL